jgi:hypothetical protein
VREAASNRSTDLGMQFRLDQWGKVDAPEMALLISLKSLKNES